MKSYIRTMSVNIYHFVFSRQNVKKGVMPQLFRGYFIKFTEAKLVENLG